MAKYIHTHYKEHNRLHIILYHYIVSSLQLFMLNTTTGRTESWAWMGNNRHWNLVQNTEQRLATTLYAWNRSIVHPCYWV